MRIEVTEIKHTCEPNLVKIPTRSLTIPFSKQIDSTILPRFLENEYSIKNRSVCDIPRSSSILAANF